MRLRGAGRPTSPTAAIRYSLPSYLGSRWTSTLRPARAHTNTNTNTNRILMRVCSHNAG